MPFFSGTPESLLQRSDSKDPSTTCRGITASGRPCRRSIAINSKGTLSGSDSAKRGALAILPDVDGIGHAAAAFYCYHHKEQAEELQAATPSKRTRAIDLKKQTSIDTLVHRLGILDLEEDHAQRKSRHSKGSRPVKRTTLPKQWQDMPEPLLSISAGEAQYHSRPAMPTKKQVRRRNKPSPWLSLLCCMMDTELKSTTPKMRPVRHHHMTDQPPRSSNLAPTTPKRDSRQHVDSGQRHHHQQPQMAEIPSTHHPNRPSIPRGPSSRTQHLLSLIPPHLSPQITSLLLSELAKPISSFDRDPGWIYIYWMTPSDEEIPDTDTASSLFSGYDSRTPSTLPRQGRKSVLLKIGRATNVQRRLNQWSRQCNHNLSLVRFYPYQDQGASPPNASTPNKVAFVQRVERLIHIELGEKRVKRTCEGCGREHREWFEIEGSRGDVKAVDGVVRRWVAWGGRMGRLQEQE
ncbi:hypothetical protein MMC25_000520 [Agyrium rufum]|nr:hypothetical protein [Agyrium rufum]